MMAKKRPIRPIVSNAVDMQDLLAAQVLGNLAMQPERVEPAAPQTRPAKQPHLRVVPKTKRAASVYAREQFTFVTKLVMLAAVAVILAAGMLLVGKLAAISQNNSAIAQKQDVLSDETRRGQQLEVQLAMTNDLERVISIASDELGMSAPKEQMCRQIVLNDVTDESAVTVQQQDRSFDLLAMLGGITEFLH